MKKNNNMNEQSNLSPVTNINQFLQLIDNQKKSDIVLYRGQTADHPLIPKIARNDASVDSKTKERKMLKELRRRGESFLENSGSSDLELMVLAQHFSMATRLLDWSTNPLIALWFALVNNERNANSYLYAYRPDKKQVIYDSSSVNPFDQARTKALRPNYNNRRITAQEGWFTLHIYSSKSGKFVPLEENTQEKSRLKKYEISGSDKSNLMEKLNILGVNYNSIFPDIEGLCRYINWIYSK